MIGQRTAVFLMNLIQDVNVLRPLMFMARRDFGFDVLILMSSKFRMRDMFGIWEAELDVLRRETDARVVVYETDWEAFRELKGSGIIFSGSESTLQEHGAPHSLFRFAPPTFLKVTLQHGFECVGFRQSAAHDLAYGKGVSFGANILCSWQPAEFQPSLARSQWNKVHVTGPTAALQMFTDTISRDPAAPGLVCENLHSVRLNAVRDLKSEFVQTFEDFCDGMDAAGKTVMLRPHPGGQYALKNHMALPPNAVIANAPIYRLDMRRFAYGISAPSSVLIDMLLADIPTAVWRDRESAMDTDNYAGLTEVSHASEWLAFAQEAANRPQPFVELQRKFLADQRVPVDPSEVFARYASIFEAAGRFEPRVRSVPVERQRLLIVANAHLPTVQVCIEHPLRPLIGSGQLLTELLTEPMLRAQMQRLDSVAAVAAWIDRQLDQFRPDVLIFSRYSGPCSSEILGWARRNSVPVIYQIDDDLLGVPRSLGEAKFAYHNDPERVATVRTLLAGSDLVYAATEALRERLNAAVPGVEAVTGPINCSGRVLNAPRAGRARVLGYVASADHLSNLKMVLPAIVGLLDRHVDLSFELFGSIPVPDELERFGPRVRKVDPIADYEAFLDALCERQWDIGIAPLVPTPFNRTKSNNKWIEYSSAGVAVIASANLVYDQCCAEGCGLLVDGLDEWDAALERLVSDEVERLAIVRRAQRKLESDYGLDQHRRQILTIIELAHQRAAAELIEEDA